MARGKSFKDNPALQFITEPEQKAIAPEGYKMKTTEQPPEGFKRNPLFVEVKSRRLQLVIQPSLYERIKKNADASGLSVNEYCHQILDEATREEE